MDDNNGGLIVLAVSLMLLTGFLSGGSKNIRPPASSTSTPATQNDSSVGGAGAGTSGTLRDDIKRLEEQTAELKESVTKLEEETSRSPYFGLVEIASVRGAGSSDPSDEYLTVQTTRKATSPLNISGWKIQSRKTFQEVAVPQAVTLFQQNTALKPEGVILAPNGYTIISSGHSPINYSFEVNKCSGYISQFTSFYPSLRTYCPYPSKEPNNIPDNIANERCLDLIKSFPACKRLVDPLPPEYTSECRQFFETRINYEGCLTYHRNDADFFTGEWRLYAGRATSAWRPRKESLVLLDNNGKVVDTYAY